ncbi:MAG: hypothetical protein HY080_10890 [Gammaproteobacteria bacterium]|nr:hypothetical protein [Gammaproteobacteria bacterium]
MLKVGSALGLVLLLSACATVSTDNPQDAAFTKQFEDQWGVKFLSLRPSAEGYLLDLRYRVINAEKAAPLLDRSIKPYLIAEKDNSKLFVPVSPKLGALRTNTKFVKENRNYFMFFANPGKHINRGDTVTIVVGDYKAEHVVVN